jgi:hypothetical protein
MDDLVILYYDCSLPIEDTYNKLIEVRKALPDKNVICIPKNYDILLDASIDELVSIQNVINTAIEMKVAQEGLFNIELPKM